MKILQLLPTLDVGGVERGVVDLARALKKRGHDTVVVSAGGELVSELQRINVPHYILPVHKKSIFSLSLVSQLAAIIERERVDIVHARSRVPAWIGWFAARKALVPFVTTCHGYYSNHALSHVMGWGKRVIVISRVIGRHMMDDFGVPAERIRLVHRGVDLSQFSVKSDSTKTKSGVKRIINVGRFSPIKGQVEFLKAVHLVRQEMGNLEVWLVGSEGKGKTKYTELILQTIRQLGLESCVKLLGKRRDIPALLAQADLLVLPTLVPEAFGRVIVEAGAVGTPVVATGSGGVLDIIDHGENGLLVPPGDIPAMADEMIKVLKDDALAEKLANSLRAKVQEKFSLDLMTQETVAVYEEVKREKKILVLKLGAAGDAILCVPSLRMLRDRFPSANISVMVDKKFASLLSNVPYVNQVIPVDRDKFSNPFYLLRLSKKLRKETFDLSVDFQNSKWTHLLAFLGAIPERYGFSRGRFGFLLNRGDRYQHAPEPPVQNQFRILSKLGIRKLDDSLELWMDPVSERKIEEMLPREFEAVEGKTVGFVLGSSPAWPTKRWPVEMFRQLADRLTKELKCRIVLVGAKEDNSLAQQFDTTSDHITDLTGKTSLTDLISVVNRLDVVVTGDTAPLHVASALKVPVIALFGPTDPKKHMPPTTQSTVFYKNLSCQPCYSGECKNKDWMACLKNISVDEVFLAVKKHLQCREQALTAKV